MTNKRLVKLVRDRINEKLFEDKVLYESVNKETHIDLLKAKLLEECVEYIREPNISELADIYEIVRALANIELGRSMEHVHEAALQKALDRGGFQEGLAMYVLVFNQDKL